MRGLLGKAGVPLIQFNVKDGAVTMTEPEKLPLGLEDDPTFIGLTPGAERGCTIKQFKAALETTLKNRVG